MKLERVLSGSPASEFALPSNSAVPPPILLADRISKAYGGNLALKPTSFAVRAGEFLALVGPSGSGKSTFLKIIGGFEKPSSGRLLIDGMDVTAAAPAQRPTSMVFQRLALFPHMTVSENIGFALKLRGVPAAERANRVEQMMALMHLRPEYAKRYPAHLSGGEQQRVALARSMISSPRILLLDEPLSALDVKLRKNLQAELRALHRQVGVTFVHVTHDLEEAMILADRICVMRNGQIIQLGTPEDIYYRPETAFVAGFIGETNLIPVEVMRVAGDGVAYRCECLEEGAASLPRDQAVEAVGTGKALLMVRPEHLRPGKAKGHPALRVKVTEIFLKGSMIQYRAVSVKGGVSLVFEVQGARRNDLMAGVELDLSFASDRAFLIQADDR